MLEIDRLLKELTLEEKASLCSGADMWHTKAVERLGIPSATTTDGPHGIRMKNGEAANVENLLLTSYPAVCFPTGSALGASFDRDLLQQVGKRIGNEAKALGAQTVLGPAINMKRSPLCGRNFEYYAEDPFLAGELAASYIDGMQGEGVSPCVKHFAVNNQETRRMSGDSRLSERTLREIYLPAFEKAVKQSKPWSIMCSYNRLNGTYACENPYLLTEILRKEWGFDGVVVTDWGAMNRRVDALRAGLDLEMPASGGARDRQIADAVRSGELDESVLDEAVRNLLCWINRITADVKKEPAQSLAEDHAFARTAAGECAVLLKNEKDLLPLRTDAKIAFVGGFAKASRFQGGGSSNINAYRVDTALETAREAGIAVTYAAGYSTQMDETDDVLFAEAVETAKQADVAVVFAGLPDRWESETYDRTDLSLPHCQNRLIEQIISMQPNTVVVLHSGSPVTMPWADKVPAILEMYLGGEASGAAAVDLLFGSVNPSGKLAETFPLRLEDTPCYLDFPGDSDTMLYNEGVYIGYRWYASRSMPVLFPFGHGQSYTSFALSDLMQDKTEITPAETVTVSVKMRNTGDRFGKETVQLYIAPPKNAAVRRPILELKGFQKISLRPGEEKNVHFTLDARAFSYYNEEISDWYAESGTYTVCVGTSSADLPLSCTVTVHSAALPFRLEDHTTCGDALEHLRGNEAFERLMQQSVFYQLAKENSDNLLAREVTRGLPLHGLASFGTPLEDIEAFINDWNTNHELSERE